MKGLSRFSWRQWIVIAVLVLLLTGTGAMAAGYWSGTQARVSDLAVSRAVEIQTQFELGQADYEAGEFYLARQRFEYVLALEPSYPGAIDMLTQTLLQLHEGGAANVEIIQPTATISPTPDNRAIEELYTNAQAQLEAMEWGPLVETILSIRDINPVYQVFEVDRMLYLAHRYNGMSKILDRGDLEGGLYDLALAEKFAPLDMQAGIYRDLARLYQIGVSFWGVYPGRAVEYFSQLAAAAPYLRDLSGIYARDRYRLALVQYGDSLSQAGEWCLAFEQYNLAQSLQDIPELQPTLTYVGEQCQISVATLTPTPTLTPVIEITPTQTITITSTLIVTITQTPAIEPSPTPTTEIVTEPTSTPTPTETMTPSQEEPTFTPTETATPTATSEGG